MKLLIKDRHNFFAGVFNATLMAIPLWVIILWPIYLLIHN